MHVQLHYFTDATFLGLLRSKKKRVLVSLKRNNIEMKRKILFGAAFIFVAWAATSCEKSCQFCKIVTRTSGGTEVTSGSASEYCGTDLIAYKAANPTITNPVTGNVTKVECTN
jgi:hypothetical protein